MNIVYKNPPPDNGVSVVSPAPEHADDLIALAALAVPEGFSWRIVDLPDVDQSRLVWTDEGPLAVAPEWIGPEVQVVQIDEGEE